MAKSTTKNKPAKKATTTKKSRTTKGKTTGTTSTKKSTVKKTVAKKAVSKKAPAKKTTAAAPKKSSTKTTVKKTTAAPKKAATRSSAKKVTTKSTTTTKRGRKVEVVQSTVKPVKKIKGYNKKELEEFKKVILDKREEIIEQLQNLKDQMMDTTTGQYVNENSPYSLHMAEQGTDAQEREKLYLWAQRETKFLGYLEDALQRIENGTYGICIDSLELKEGPHLIPKNRLLAVPHTQHCVDCKNKKK